MEITELLTWLGIGLCVLQSGTFSGLNLAMFGLSALVLQSKAGAGDQDAARLMAMRKDSNFLLTTILWGNVGTNVLLTLLSDSVMAGVLGFFFSTFVITFGGEILPQAYFSRHALKMATLMRPVLRFWQFVLYPIAKPTALILDAWLGPEAIEYPAESELREALKRQVAAPGSEVSRVEGIGALNFLALDDLPIQSVGNPLASNSIISLEEVEGALVFPSFKGLPTDPFLQQVLASGKKWIVLANARGVPRLALNANSFIRHALASHSPLDINRFCHPPIVVNNPNARLGEVLPQLTVNREYIGDHVIDQDLILLWSEPRRIITGADLFGRLLQGIARPI